MGGTALSLGKSGSPHERNLMPGTKIVNAIVLRSVAYRDFDRMLTLFSREEGAVSACARGAHKPNSPLSAAATQFCTGEYVLEERNGRYNVKSCMLDGAFYPLREEPRALSYAAALTQVCEEIVQAGDPNEELYDMLLRALTYLSFDREHDATNIVFPFFMRAMVLSGHGVMLTRCASCGGRIVDARFDDMAGGVVCARHQNRNLPVITGEDMKQMQDAVKGEYRPSEGDVKRLCRILGIFVRTQLERDFTALTFAENME